MKPESSRKTAPSHGLLNDRTAIRTPQVNSLAEPQEAIVTKAPENDKSFRFSLFELGGALGDLGVLLPLTVALITLNHMNATSVFLVVGLAYIVTGVFYRIPMPVQPLKAVAAIAIASGLSAGVISAVGRAMRSAR